MSGGTLSVVNEEQMLADPECEADFDKAYNKLVKKFYQEQGPNLLIPEEDLYKADQRGLDIGEVQKKIQEDQRRKDEKIRMLKQIQEEKELKGCTFAPQMLTKKKNQGEKRDLNKFLEDQQKYLELKQKKQLERKEKALQSEQSVMAPVPMVNEKSKKLLEKKLKKQEEPQRQSNSVTRPDNAASRVKKPLEARKRLASPQPTESFKPSISKKSQQMAEKQRAGQKIEDHLLLEGKRLKEKMAKKEQDLKQHQNAKVTNSTSEKYIIAKFNREFDLVLAEMFEDEKEEA